MKSRKKPSELRSSPCRSAYFSSMPNHEMPLKTNGRQSDDLVDVLVPPPAWSSQSSRSPLEAARKSGGGDGGGDGGAGGGIVSGAGQKSVKPHLAQFTLCCAQNPAAVAHRHSPHLLACLSAQQPQATL